MSHPTTLPKLIVISGPTACGKSSLGVTLAQQFHGEIVSADSRQIYRGLDLGTGKITTQEMEGVPHHLLDIIDPNQSYSVAQFQQDAVTAIHQIIARGKVPFLVGGTGLYIRAVVEGFSFSDSTPDPTLRAQLERRTAQELYQTFQELTGLTLNESEQWNHQRLIRGVEKAMAGTYGETPSAPLFGVLQLGVSFPRETICQRIDQRLLLRIEQGMIEEVATLRAQGATDEFLEGLGLEYRYIRRYLDGELPTQEALVDELGRAIKRFAKRQTQWFSKDNIHWLQMEAQPVPQGYALIEDFLSPTHYET